MNFAVCSNKLLDETIDLLRNKPVNSTYMERLFLVDRAEDMFSHLPQPLYVGNATGYVLENASCPLKPYDIILGRFPEHVPEGDEERLFLEIKQRRENQRGTFFTDIGHCCFDWEFLLKNGLGGYIEKAENKLKELKNEEQRNFVSGMLMIYKAYANFISRYADVAEKAGLYDAAAVCRNISSGAPETFREAVQLISFILGIYSIYFGKCATICCGRMDILLLPFYEKDIDKGTLTREDAGYILDDFNCKTSMVLGRGEHQMSLYADNNTGWFRNPMYDSPVYVILGGYPEFGVYKSNPLTKLFLERIHPRLENPVFIYRRTKYTPDDEWTLVCDKLRQNASVIVYNDETIIPGFIYSGISPEDAAGYTLHGCNWPDVAHKSVHAKYIAGCIPTIIMKSIFDENGKFIKPFLSIDDIYDAIAADYRNELNAAAKDMRERCNINDKSVYTLSHRDCFMEGPLDAAKGVLYSSPYQLCINRLRHIGTAADIMTSLEDLLFGENPVSAEVIEEALAADFTGYETLQKRARSLPKFGQDNERADSHAVRLMNLFTDIAKEEGVNPKTGRQDVFFFSATTGDSNHIVSGKNLGATPDGRSAGKPVSENLSPYPGCSDSVTAILNSVSKLPFDRFAGGVLNLKLPKNTVSGDSGLAILKALLETYFENGGMQIQLSVTDVNELYAAQKNPDDYRDLMVRITGYSAVFVDMSKEAQNEIIRRDELT